MQRTRRYRPPARVPARHWKTPGTWRDAWVGPAIAWMKHCGPKTTKLAEQGRMFARGLFAKDPETCRIRNERAKASDAVRDAQAMAAGWSQGLPMADCIERAANGVDSMYRL